MTASFDAVEPSYNVAQDGAHVDAQIGVVHGDVAFYTISGDATPEAKYQVALRYLDGNMPRQAEKLFREAFVTGHRSTQISYYWALSVLSGRSFDHLGDVEFDQLADAFAMAARSRADEWSVALGVVASLIQSLAAQEQQSDADTRSFDDALARYGQLRPDRRDEIRRHLEMVLVGGIQDQLELRDAAEVAQRRMANNRRNRVWKFFEPTPVGPRPLPLLAREAWGKDLAKAAGGAVLGLASLYLGGALLVGHHVALLIGSVLLYLAGAYLAVRYGREHYAVIARSRWSDARFQDTRPNEAELWDDECSAFAAAVGRSIDRRFEARKPRREGGSTWMENSSSMRAALQREIVEQYADMGPLPRVRTIRWLIDWHADQSYSAWRNGTLYSYPAERGNPRMTAVLSIMGAVAVAGGLLMELVNAAWGAPVPGSLVILGCIAATVLLWKGGSAAWGKAATATCGSQESERRLAAETRAFEDWEQVLADRPTDAEIATWLDYDKAHIKAAALKQYGLANRDLIAHVVLTGPAHGSFRARFKYGPPRYSKYEIQLFLLTGSGVRQVSVQLDLATGAITNERRRSFRYDAISSAEVTHTGGSRRHSANGMPDAEKPASPQEFRLNLNNMQAVHVPVGNFDEGLIDRVMEDTEYLLELARDTSGVTSALRILEAVAAEGSEWVRQERQRRRRRMMDYQSRQGIPRQLDRSQELPTSPIGIQRVGGFRN
jgi:hypothetical protein